MPAVESPGVELNRALRSHAPAEAAAWFLRAAGHGCPRAQFCAGLAYHRGNGVPLDYHRARTWYERAAGRADRNAMANLGVLYLRGQGVAADPLEAYTWICSAVGLGHGSLRPLLEDLESVVRGEACPSPRLASAAPVEPTVAPCTLPQCDPSRCGET